MPMISACVRMTSIQYWLKTSGATTASMRPPMPITRSVTSFCLVHENLPNSPCGRKASTSASSMKVNTIEYWVQQLLPAVGR